MARITRVKIVITIIGMIAAIFGCLGFTGGISVMIISVYLIAVVAQGENNV